MNGALLAMDKVRGLMEVAKASDISRRISLVSDFPHTPFSLNFEVPVNVEFVSSFPLSTRHCMFTFKKCNNNSYLCSYS